MGVECDGERVEVLLDPGQTAFAAFGLPRSVVGSYSPQTLLMYARKIVRGEALQKLEDGEDTSQLGGDFVVDKHGNVALSHPSQHSSDRMTPVQAVECVLRVAGVSTEGLLPAVGGQVAEDT
mmetsp:Transcript_8870/g.21009  ORF Transcript_8870/g.21009 Transcript_8870/m.21009 type:complete len:122 (-) Transcript_8870:394-759(-)